MLDVARTWKVRWKQSMPCSELLLKDFPTLSLTCCCLFLVLLAVVSTWVWEDLKLALGSSWQRGKEQSRKYFLWKKVKKDVRLSKQRLKIASLIGWIFHFMENVPKYYNKIHNVFPPPSHCKTRESWHINQNQIHPLSFHTLKQYRVGWSWY